MLGKSYWIWHYGDYEIFHSMNIHLRRESKGCHIPAFWKISTPYASVKFRKEFECESGYIICHINGDGHIAVDNIRYQQKTRIELTAGTHIVEVCVSNYGGLPAIFVESNVCPSDESWYCNHFAGDFITVGCNKYFCSAEQNPEVFPFQYKNIVPIGIESIGNGILYDFGTELFGFLNINGVNKNEVLNVFYGESREEALDTNYSYITDKVYGDDRYRLLQRAFRYVYIIGATEECFVSADYEYLPLESVGNFKCDNQLFNNIYSVASYTFHLNCRECFLDGIKRDRWVWAGDAFQSARINRYLFADKEIEQRTLIGLIGKLPIEQHVNTIMDYSLFWLIMFYEHYMAYGDKNFIEHMYPMANELLDFCETRLNIDGFMEGLADDWTFIDWSNIEKCGAVCAEQMLLVKAYSAMADISAELGGKNSCELYAKAIELKNKINKYYWNEEKGAYIDSYISGTNHVTRHANIFAIMFDIANDKQAQSIVDNVLTNEEITKITTPYFEAYELDALAKMGRFKEIENIIGSYWGSMIKLGAKTIWEEFNPDNSGIEHYAMYGGKYDKSLCHAWGAGPIYLFGRYYLGVYATSAGYQTFNVQPNSSTLCDMNGKVSINNGVVSVSLKNNVLSVEASRTGGTLIINGNKYILNANEPLVICLSKGKEL